MQTIDTAKLKEIAKSSLTAEKTLMLLALRERSKAFSNMKVVRKQLGEMGVTVIDDAYTQLWKDLEAAGVGSIIYGRRGQADRFKWNYSLKSVGSAAIEGKAAAKAFVSKAGPKKAHTRSIVNVPPSPTIKPKAVGPTIIPKSAPSDNRTLYTLLVRQGQFVEIIAPQGLTPSEVLQAVSKLCALIA